MRSTFLLIALICLFTVNGQNCPFSYNYQGDFDLCLSRERYSDGCVVLDTSTHWWRNTACDDPGSGGGAYFCGHMVTTKHTTQQPDTTKSPPNLNCLPDLCCPTRCKYFAHDGGQSLYLVGGYSDSNETWWWTDGTTFDYQRGGCDFHIISGSEQLLYIRNGVGSIDECSTYCPEMGLWLMRHRQSDPSTPYLVCKR
ncbi:unnamed protein product, partial [Mesorhabditis belari]|uniref:C-type lectin domain-containing protein n=1 Tax=Mesorhabditis belari TaxID=2138241 RepID=A0AAF3FIL9_9BILA